MPRKSHNHRLDLPALELDCMRMLWALGRGTVHQIRARLTPERPLAYTTIMTVMDHLTRKGIVERQKRGRAFVYQPLVSEGAVLEHALGRLAHNFFLSSRERLRRYVEGGSLAASMRPPTPVMPLAPGTESGPRAQRVQPNVEIDPSLL